MRRNITMFTAAALVLVAGAAVTLPVLTRGEANASTSTSLAINVGSPAGCVSVGVGAEVEVSVDISAVNSLTSWEATIVHDRDILEVTAQDAGVFLRKDGGSVLDASEPLPDANGRHFLSAGLIGAGVSGGGALGTLTFQALEAGITSIEIPQRDLNGDGKADEGVRLTGQNGVIIGDVNNDGFFDGPVASAAIAVGQPCGPVPTTSPTEPPTPGPSPTPSPTAAPTAVPTSTSSAAPSPTAGPATGTPAPTSPLTSTPTSSATAPATPTASPVPGAELTWGDANCSGSADPVDSLLTLRHDAGLSVSTGACPLLGQQLNVAAVHTWGDIDCTGDVGVVDALKLLRFDAGMEVAATAGCPQLGQEIVIAPQPQ
ncbi:MAG TPA: hypothetical protein VMR52_07880 [Dehalococcoidia bacterium]|nr:hypothetical protein [Dehalococcoidia bacterium]